MKKRENSHYSPDFKFRVVQDVLQGKYSKEEARKIYGIKGKSAILYWIRQFSGQSNYQECTMPTMSLEDMKIKKNESAKDSKIKELEEQLRVETLRADLWQKMVDVAEEQLNVNIRKKYGAK